MCSIGKYRLTNDASMHKNKILYIIYIILIYNIHEPSGVRGTKYNN